MPNNKSIRILRGTNANIHSHRDDLLDSGQLLYNTDKKYLTIGKGSDTKMNALPIVVRELNGLFADSSKITDATSGDNYYINDNSGQSLKIYSSKGVEIVGTNSITCNKAPLITETVPTTDSTTKTATTKWVKTATGNTTLNAASADKLNTDAGSNTKFIYFRSGKPVVTSTTTGANNKPVYFSSGEVTASTATIGSSTKPIYMNSGTITASNSTVGANNKPVYLSSGTITASSSTVGSSSRPVYFNAGTVTQTGNSLDVSVTGNANTATTATNATKINVSGTYRSVTFSNGILSFS